MKLNYKNLRDYMIEEQLKKRGITDKKILNAFSEIPREEFLPESLKKYAYEDMALPIDHKQTISQPYIVALMTTLLEPKENDIVLEIGTGSGYQAAILSKLVKKVYSIEIIKELANLAKKTLSKLNIKNVQIILGDCLSTPELKKNKFDKIIFTAATPKSIIHESKNFLKEKGIVIAPEDYINNVQKLKKYIKKDNKLTLIKNGPIVKFVPLTGKKGLYF